MTKWNIGIKHINVGQGDAAVLYIEELSADGKIVASGLNRLALIDGGDAVVSNGNYRNLTETIQETLNEINAGKIEEKQQFDLVINTHDDDDHIQGIFTLFGDKNHQGKFDNTFYYEQGVIRYDKHELVINQENRLDILANQRKIIPIYCSDLQYSLAKGSAAADNYNVDVLLGDSFIGEDLFWNFAPFNIYDYHTFTRLEKLKDEYAKRFNNITGCENSRLLHEIKELKIKISASGLHLDDVPSFKSKIDTTIACLSKNSSDMRDKVLQHFYGEYLIVIKKDENQCLEDLKKPDYKNAISGSVKELETYIPLLIEINKIIELNDITNNLVYLQPSPNLKEYIKDGTILKAIDLLQEFCEICKANNAIEKAMNNAIDGVKGLPLFKDIKNLLIKQDDFKNIDRGLESIRSEYTEILESMFKNLEPLKIDNRVTFNISNCRKKISNRNKARFKLISSISFELSLLFDPSVSYSSSEELLIIGSTIKLNSQILDKLKTDEAMLIEKSSEEKKQDLTAINKIIIKDLTSKINFFKSNIGDLKARINHFFELLKKINLDKLSDLVDKKNSEVAAILNGCATSREILLNEFTNLIILLNKINIEEISKLSQQFSTQINMLPESTSADFKASVENLELCAKLINQEITDTLKNYKAYIDYFSIANLTQLNTALLSFKKIQDLETDITDKPLLLCISANEKVAQNEKMIKVYKNNLTIAKESVTAQNRRSIVLLLLSEKDEVLHYLGGDSTETIERRIAQWLDAQNIKPCPVMKLSHHGARGSTPPELVTSLRPKLAIVSADNGAMHGHPAIDLLEYLHLYNTAFSNRKINIIATSYRAKLKIEEYNRNSISDAKNSLLDMKKSYEEAFAKYFSRTHGEITDCIKAYIGYSIDDIIASTEFEETKGNKGALGEFINNIPKALDERFKTLFKDDSILSNVKKIEKINIFKDFYCIDLHDDYSTFKIAFNNLLRSLWYDSKKCLYKNHALDVLKQYNKIFYDNYKLMNYFIYKIFCDSCKEGTVPFVASTIDEKLYKYVYHQAIYGGDPDKIGKNKNIHIKYISNSIEPEIAITTIKDENNKTLKGGNECVYTLTAGGIKLDREKPRPKNILHSIYSAPMIQSSFDKKSIIFLDALKKYELFDEENLESYLNDILNKWFNNFSIDEIFCGVKKSSGLLNDNYQQLTFSARINDTTQLIKLTGEIADNGELNFSISNIEHENKLSIYTLAKAAGYFTLVDEKTNLLINTLSVISDINLSVENININFNPDNNYQTHLIFRQKLPSFSIGNISFDEIKLTFDSLAYLESNQSMILSTKSYLDAELKIAGKSLPKLLYQEKMLKNKDIHNLLNVRVDLNHHGNGSLVLWPNCDFSNGLLSNLLPDNLTNVFEQSNFKFDLIKRLEIQFSLSKQKINLLSIDTGIVFNYENLHFEFATNVSLILNNSTSVYVNGSLKINQSEENNKNNFRNIIESMPYYDENTNLVFSDIENYPLADVTFSANLTEKSYLISGKIGSDDQKTSYKINDYLSINSIGFTLSNDNVNLDLSLTGFLNIVNTPCLIHIQRKNALWEFTGGISYLSLHSIADKFDIDKSYIPDFVIKDALLQIKNIGSSAVEFGLKANLGISNIIFDVDFSATNEKKNLTISWANYNNSNFMLKDLMDNYNVNMELPSLPDDGVNEGTVKPFNFMLNKAEFIGIVEKNNKFNFKLLGEFLFGNSSCSIAIRYINNRWDFTGSLEELDLKDILSVFKINTAGLPTFHFNNVTLEVVKPEKQSAYFTLNGEMLINETSLDFEFDSSNKTLKAILDTTKASNLTLNKLINSTGMDLTIPAGLDFALSSITINCNFQDEQYSFELEAASEDKLITIYMTCLAQENNQRPKYVLINVASKDNVKKLVIADVPLLGELNNPINDLILFYFNNAAKNAIKKDTKLKGYFEKLNETIFEKVKPGLSLSFKITPPYDKESFVNVLQITSELSQDAPKLLSHNTQRLLKNENPEEVKNNSIKWITINKDLKLLRLERIGVSHSDDNLYIYLDGILQSSKVKFQLKEFGVGLPLGFFLGSKNIKDCSPAFKISGVGLSVEVSTLTISGYFKLAQPSEDEKYKFEGSVLIKTDAISIQAMGAYSKPKKDNEGPSLFIFAHVGSSKGFGGPPQFYIKGFSGGFGYNQEILPIEIKDVSTYPLLTMASENSLSNTSEVISRIQNLIVKKLDKKWLAVGLKFTSFNIINSDALAIASFGDKLKFDLFGLAKMSLPIANNAAKTPVRVFANVEMALLASLKPEEGSFSIIAELTNKSYIFDDNCKLTGGAAICTWFGNNPYSGDFVVTVGGYHPRFKKPEHYPDVPRLGFNWQVNKDFVLKGETYFALTPSCIMAGSLLQALYNSGDLRAWFDAYFDVLISWAPFFYELDMAVSVGVVYQLNLLLIRKTIEAHIAARLNLWGPPMGGRVSIDLSCITITIHFGKDKSAPVKLTWDDFKKLLPNAEHEKIKACEISCENGLINKENNTWIVNSDFAFSTKSAIPLTEIILNGIAIKSDRKPINIKPMKKEEVTAVQRIWFTKIDYFGSEAVKSYTGTDLKSNMPAALWGDPNKSVSNPSADLIAGCLTGASIFQKIDTYSPINKKVELLKISDQTNFNSDSSPQHKLTFAGNSVDVDNKKLISKLSELNLFVTREPKKLLSKAKTSDTESGVIINQRLSI